MSLSRFAHSAGRNLRYAVIALATLAAIVFSVSNRQPATVSLFPLPYEAELPTFLLALLFFSAGVLTAGTLTWRRVASSRRRQRVQSRELNALRDELTGLRLSQNSARSLAKTA